MELECRVRKFLVNNPKIKKKYQGFVYGKAKGVVKLPKNRSLLLRMVGVIHGDGNMSGGRLLITEKDYGFQKVILKSFKELFGVKMNLFFDKNRNTYYLHTKNRIVYEFFAQIFEIPRGAVREKIVLPKYFNDLTKQERRAYVGGLFDSEGSIKKRQAEVNFCTTSEELFEFVKKILNDEKIKFSAYERTRRKKEYNIYIYGKDRLKQFQKKIGFSHPTKIKKLAKFLGCTKNPGSPSCKSCRLRCCM